MAEDRLSRKEIKQIRSMLELAAAYDGNVADVAALERLQRDAACDALRALTEREAASILRAMEVETVNRDRLGIRVAALRAAGIRDMERLCALSVEQLEAVHGIGADAAYLIYTVAGRIRREVNEGLKVRISPDDRNEAATLLLRTVHGAMQADGLSRAALALQEEYRDRLDAVCAAARPASGLLRWLFAPAEKKREAQAAAQELYTLLTGDYGERAREITGAAAALEEPDDEALWRDFARRGAAYFAQLDRLGRELSASVDNSYNGLPEELVREVEQQPLRLDTLRATLRGYQEFGVRYILRQGEVLLGDEMGLGKTVQAIAAMVSLHALGATHFMVVCPASVLVNWERELRQFCELAVIPIRGGDFPALGRWLECGGVAVTSYESISRFALPPDFGFSLLVADEAHYVKNPEALRTLTLLLIKAKAQRTLFMTGTPLENRVDEMCALIGCLRPDIAAELRQMKYISSAPQFRERLAPVYLRRTRGEVLGELPELIEKEQWCEMTAAEWRQYLLSVAAENFMAMRQLSWELPDPTASSKAKRLTELCDMAREEGRKVLVFSYFRKTLAAAKAVLGERALGPITGSVPPGLRQQLVDEFTAAGDGAVLICQVQAGGTGLNIQAASVVIFCEPQIKPSLERQALSRAYRMGQVRSVLVHRLLCDNTVDERILELLREKQELFDSFAEESAAGSEYLKAERSLAAAIIAAEKQRLLPAPGAEK